MSHYHNLFLLLEQAGSQYNTIREMKNRIPRKMKRYLTQPQENAIQNKTRYGNLTLKELKLQVGTMERYNQPATPQSQLKYNVTDKGHTSFVPLQAKIQHKRNALKRLPELSNTPAPSNGNQAPRSLHNPLFKNTNPLFVVNTLFQIMKDDITLHESVPPKQPPRPKRELPTQHSKKSSCSQFDNITAKSVKMYRPPRILDNELNRIAHQTTFSRRKIYSEEKTRPKIEKDANLLTFYRPKEHEETNEFL